MALFRGLCFGGVEFWRSRVLAESSFGGIEFWGRRVLGASSFFLSQDGPSFVCLEIYSGCNVKITATNSFFLNPKNVPNYPPVV